jgi:hypothetical protein
MSVFTPYNNYRVTFPFLTPGNIIKIQDKFYLVVTTRHNRKTVALVGAQTKFAFALDSGTTYESLTGNLNKNRIVHLQYVAIDTAQVNPEFFWGTQPLQSKDVDDTCSTVTANLAAPLPVDRWSYDQSMRLLVSETASQSYYFEIVEYEIVSYTGAPPRPYWQIMANGQAILVESDEQAKAMAALKLG